ncbi:hypothetical protein PGIGA_G00144840, partial [Pangasianodon gigas]|nr:hypothetical protein [Pangasianodon gigas]
MEGNFSLTITAADYSRRGVYTCQCGGKGVCDVRLSIESVALAGQIDPGSSLMLDVPMSGSVKVTFIRFGDESQSSVTLCEVTGGKVHHHPEYKNRISFRSSFTLNKLRPSDSGVYTVWDTNDELIATYTL